MTVATKTGVRVTHSNSVSMNVRHIFQPHSEWYQSLSYVKLTKVPLTWERSVQAFSYTQILTRHVYCPCMESTQSALVFAQFTKRQLIPAFKISPVTLHAGAIETTIEVGVESFFGNTYVRDFIPKSGGLWLSSSLCRSLLDSTQRRCPIDSAECLWLAKK